MSWTQLQQLTLAVIAGAGTVTAAAQNLVWSAPRNDAALVAGPHDLSAGKVVQSTGGEIIGTVRDVVRNSVTGDPDYVLISTSTGTAAMPFWAARHLLRDAHFVLSPAQLESAPRVPDSMDRTDASWKAAADRYWEAYR